ncbi:MAG: GntR family transcriptional regulator, partial [Anaerolineales bacterium]
MTENDRANLLSEQAYQQIKLMIITLDLPPGSFVNEKELIERLDLGRTPIREALLR